MGLATPPITPWHNASTAANPFVATPCTVGSSGHQPSPSASVHPAQRRPQTSLQGTPTKHGAVLRQLADAVPAPPPAVMKSKLSEWENEVARYFGDLEPPVYGLKKGQRVAIHRTYNATQHMLSFFPKPTSEQTLAMAEALYHRRIGLIFSQDDKYAYRFNNMG